MKLKKFFALLAENGNKDLQRYVIGNPSVDYDSFFGSIILAYLLSTTTGHLHIPLIDCSRKDLKLRFQIEAVLEKIKINPNVLHFREFSQQPYPEGIYNLYDHNLRQNIKNVEYIVDHHSFNPNHINARKYLIDTMGSGLTLLYYLIQPKKIPQININQQKQNNFILKLNQFVKKQPFEKFKDETIMDDDIKEIIRYGILIDCFNFDKKLKQRWTKFDKLAVESIQEEITCLQGYDWLQSLKYDDENSKKLTFHQNLIKDRKIFTYGKIKCIYSAIFLNPTTFYSHYKDQIQNQFKTQQQNCDIYFIMCVFKNEKKEFERQLIFRINHHNQNDIQGILQPKLTALNLINCGLVGDWKRWKDPSKTISRKVFEPQIKNLFEKYV